MRLVSFGRVGLQGSGFSRPKPLLLLAYLTLEGPQERRRLAELFWRGSDAKSLGYLSVVLAQFKREGAGGVFPDAPGVNPLPSLVGCDALEFLEHLERGDLERAVGLYAGPFLHDLGKPLPDLETGQEVLDWVLERREFLAQKAQAAMLELAEQYLSKGQGKEARALVERAFGLPEAPEPEPAQLARFQRVLSQTGSGLATNLEGTLRANLDDLSEPARKVFLALSLQPQTNLTIVRTALGLTLSLLSEAREELILAGLTDAQGRVLAGEMPRRWLEEHPSERMPLLLALARTTPPEAAFELYRQVYASTQGFGGAGDLARARTAYCVQAKTLMDALRFAEVAGLMGELRSAERVAEADPDPQSRFLEAYALERLGRFREALELIQVFPPEQHNPNLVALKSVLLWRTGSSLEAQKAAEWAVGSGLDWLWARATANNTLGYLAHSAGEFLEAASLFKKSASLYLSSGEKNRYVGSLNNYAIALDRLAEAAEKEGRDGQALEKHQADAEQAYRQTLDALDQAGENPALRARVLLNLGVLWERRKDWDKAARFYLEASSFAQSTGALDMAARLQLSLGVVFDKRNLPEQSRASYSRAIELASKAGEFLIQGQAIGNLAVLDSDPDGMEVALDLIGQTGNSDTLLRYQGFYERVLLDNFEKALLANDAAHAYQLLGKLAGLYERLDSAGKADKVQSAVRALLNIHDTRPHKDLLMALMPGAANPQMSADRRN